MTANAREVSCRAQEFKNECARFGGRSSAFDPLFHP